MLTPEQTRLRLKDTELMELWKENERLIKKVHSLKVGFKEILLASAELNGMKISDKVKLKSLANEIESKV